AGAQFVKRDVAAIGCRTASEFSLKLIPFEFLAGFVRDFQFVAGLGVPPRVPTPRAANAQEDDERNHGRERRLAAAPAPAAFDHADRARPYRFAGAESVQIVGQEPSRRVAIARVFLEALEADGL